MKITLDIEEKVNVSDLILLIEKFYPSKQINLIMPHKNDKIKIFDGVNDLKVLRKEKFKVYARDNPLQNF